MGKRLSFSFIAIMIICLAWLSYHIGTRSWENNLIHKDASIYYSYLPAAFICKDLSLDFSKETPANCQDRFSTLKTEAGDRVFKMTVGLAILHLPFFLLGHFTAHITNAVANGYSAPYIIWLLIGNLFYLIIGLNFLRKILKRYFSDLITALVLMSVYFGTNLMWYTFEEAFYSHAYSFALISALIYLTIKWHEKPGYFISIILGLTMGLISLIRPVNAILCFIPILYGISNLSTFRTKIQLLRSHLPKVAVVLICSCVVLLPQLLYWKFVTENWIFYSYIGEPFFFDKPHIFEGLLGFRKGWLIYTPIMFLGVLGVLLLFKYIKELFSSYLLLLPFIYVSFSWWCWWYGGSYGMRPFIDIYAFMAIPFGLTLKICFSKKWSKVLVLILISFLISLNCFQTWQHKQGFLHYDAMTYEAYKEIWGKTHYTEAWSYKVRFTDPLRSRKGKPEAYHEEELYSGKYSLRAFNIKFISSNLEDGGVMSASRFDQNEWERFIFEPLGGNKIAIRAYNNKYVCADMSVGGLLSANRDTVGDWETFSIHFLGDNKIALETTDGFFVSAQKNSGQDILTANTTEIGITEVFRIYEWE